MEQKHLDKNTWHVSTMFLFPSGIFPSDMDLVTVIPGPTAPTNGAGGYDAMLYTPYLVSWCLRKREAGGLWLMEVLWVGRVGRDFVGFFQMEALFGCFSWVKPTREM